MRHPKRGSATRPVKITAVQVPKFTEPGLRVPCASTWIGLSLMGNPSP